MQPSMHVQHHSADMLLHYQHHSRLHGSHPDAVASSSGNRFMNPYLGFDWPSSFFNASMAAAAAAAAVSTPSSTCGSQVSHFTPPRQTLAPPSMSFLHPDNFHHLQPLGDQLNLDPVDELASNTSTISQYDHVGGAPSSPLSLGVHKEHIHERGNTDDRSVGESETHRDLLLSHPEDDRMQD